MEKKNNILIWVNFLILSLIIVLSMSNWIMLRLPKDIQEPIEINDFKFSVIMNVTTGSSDNAETYTTQDLLFIGSPYNNWFSVTQKNKDFYVMFSDGITSPESYCIKNILKPYTDYYITVKATDKTLIFTLNNQSFLWESKHWKDIDLQEPVVIGSCIYLDKPYKYCYKFHGVIHSHKVGMSQRYILEQEGKDVFEYSVFGSPNQKIGNFTGQKKLGDFNA